MIDWKDVNTRYCGIGATTEIVGDRWSSLILRDVIFGVHRYDELLDHLGVSTAVLADRLKKLVEHGLLRKVPYQSEGRRRRHEYHLTERGIGLLHVQLALAEFGYEHLVEHQHRLVSVVDRDSGQRVTVALVREDGTPVGFDSIELQVNETAAAG